MNRRILLVVFASGLASGAAADVIRDQRYDGRESGRVAQDFPDVPQFSTYHFDDFTIDRAWAIMTATAQGFEIFGGDPLLNQQVIGAITAEPSILAEPILYSAHGSEDENFRMMVDFGGERLEPGTYWLSIWVVRTYSPGGQWMWGTTQGVSGSEPYYHNPGGAFGFGTKPIPASFVAHEFADLAYTLEGDPADCPWDCDADGALDLFDFLCYVNQFNAGDERADCDADGALDLFDFLCYVNGFNGRC